MGTIKGLSPPEEPLIYGFLSNPFRNLERLRTPVFFFVRLYGDGSLRVGLNVSVLYVLPGEGRAGSSDSYGVLDTLTHACDVNINTTKINHPVPLLARSFGLLHSES